MRRPLRLAAAALAAAAPLVTAPLAAPLAAQQPNASYADAFELPRRRGDPALAYTVRVDTADVRAYAVTLDVERPPLDADGASTTLAFARWAPGAYRLAEFGRYAGEMTATWGGRPAIVTRSADGGTARVTFGDGRRGTRPPAGARLRVAYRVSLGPGGHVPNNRSFLGPRGGLFDGPLTYAFLPGRERLPARVRWEVPAGWQLVTGLEPTSDPRAFVARSVDVLLDAPVLAGPAPALRSWRFAVDGVPHRVALWSGADATPFDTARCVAVADTIVRTARALMGELPYREYAFLFVDGAGGGLEHLNSTTIGVSTPRLARDPAASAEVTAHEFFHLWNVKRLRPVELGPFDYGRAVRTPNLWWSEGVTDHFSAALLRRAALVDSAGAVADLEDALGSWLNNPAATRVSPERSSLTAWDRPDVNGGYAISYYLQGRLLGDLFDLAIRDATGGARGLDDALRALYDAHAGARGFVAADVERAARGACACDLAPVFAAHVRAARPVDWDRWLGLAGWRLDTLRGVVADSAGRPRPDLRASAVGYGGIGSAGGQAGEPPRLSIPTPEGAWYRAGLRTGDRLATVNGRPVASPEAFRAALAGARVGDTVAVQATRDGRPVRAAVVLAPYTALRTRLRDLPAPTARQRLVRQAWLRGPEGGAPKEQAP
jgi:predicted metalloprotease with PDZ domain